MLYVKYAMLKRNINTEKLIEVKDMKLVDVKNKICQTIRKTQIVLRIFYLTVNLN